MSTWRTPRTSECMALHGGEDFADVNVKDLEMGDELFQCCHMGPQKRKETGELEQRDTAWKLPLLALQMEDKPGVKACRKPRGSWKRPRNWFLPGASKEEHSPADTWILVQWDLSQTSDLQNYHIINLHGFKPPGLWWFITARRSGYFARPCTSPGSIKSSVSLEQGLCMMSSAWLFSQHTQCDFQFEFRIMNLSTQAQKWYQILLRAGPSTYLRNFADWREEAGLLIC